MLSLLEETCYAYTQIQIIKCENVMLEVTQYKSLFPTPSEILKLLLFISNPLQDFTSIIHKSNEYIFRCQLDYNTCIFRYSSIALGSLTLALQEMGFNTFLSQVIQMVSMFGISFDMEEVEACKNAISKAMSSNNYEETQEDFLFMVEDSNLLESSQS